MNLEAGPKQEKFSQVLDRIDLRLADPSVNSSLPKEMKQAKDNFKSVLKMVSLI